MNAKSTGRTTPIFLNPEAQADADAIEARALAAIEADENKANSVVGIDYKREYKQRAREAGLRGKAPKRSRWDWLAQELAKRTLNKKEQIMVEAFEAILDANGVEHAHWNRTTKGWQGRLRMTGRLALQRVVAETGILKTAEGEQLEAPADWVAKYLR